MLSSYGHNKGTGETARIGGHEGFEALKLYQFLIQLLNFADFVSDSSHQKKLVLLQKTGIMKREPQSQIASILLECVTYG